VKEVPDIIEVYGSAITIPAARGQSTTIMLRLPQRPLPDPASMQLHAGGVRFVLHALVDLVRITPSSKSRSRKAAPGSA